MARPRVGVTGPDRGGVVAWEMTRAAIVRAGGEALRITPTRGHSLDGLDALVIGGGADIDPALYGEEHEPMSELMVHSRSAVAGKRTPALSLLLAPTLFLARKVFERHTLVPVDTSRDVLERGLIERALSRDTPILGICRGAQLLNVCLGGTLFRDVGSFYAETPQHRTVLPRKKVAIREGTLLARVIGAAPCLVNALHHQAIDALGRTVAIAANEENGIVQAIEVTSARFALGVQWHPEYIPQHRRQRAIFEALIAAS